MRNIFLSVLACIALLVVTMLPLTGTMKSYEIEVISRTSKEKLSDESIIDTSNYNAPTIKNFQQQWLIVKSYNNYAPSGMPDFDERQDKWQKITRGDDNIMNSTVTDDDIPVGANPQNPNCIAPGPDSHLDSTPAGDDEVKYYFCGPTALADIIWWIDSRHEKKNLSEDNNGDTCDILSNFSGVSDDHHEDNVPLFIENLAVRSGTVYKCITDVKDLNETISDVINNESSYAYKCEIINWPTIAQMANWIKLGYAVLLRIDVQFPPGYWHFVALNGVNQNNNQIEISDPEHDEADPPGSYTEHNNASNVSHDIYTTEFRSQITWILNYPEDFSPGGNMTQITHAIVANPKPVIDTGFIDPHISTDVGGSLKDQFRLLSETEFTDDVEAYYYLPDGTMYAGGAMVNGIPFEPLIEGNVLKWLLAPMNPGDLYEVELNIIAIDPPSLELERRVRCWGFCPMLGKQVYDDDFGIFEILNNPPSKPNIDGQLSGKAGTDYYYNISGDDPDGNDIWVLIEWGDGTNTSWLGPYVRSYKFNESHTWKEKDSYTVRAIARDEFGAESQWGTLNITIPKNKAFTFNFNLFKWLLERFSSLSQILLYARNII